MSLNSPEIDRILEELDLPGQHIQKIIQNDFRNLYLQIFRPPQAWWMRICLENPWVRVHTTTRPPRAKRSHQRFEDFLWSRIKGGRIAAAEHVFQDRIVRLDVDRSGVRTLVYIRLWGTRANIIVTDPDGTILDAFFRKPAQGIETGGSFIPEPPAGDAKPRSIRAVEGTRTLNEQVEQEYRHLEAQRDRELLTNRCRRALEKQERRTTARLAEIDAGRAQQDAQNRNRHFGDLILAHIHAAVPGARWIEAEDYLDDNRVVRIELDPTKSAAENAQAYYDRARRAEESAAYLDSSSAALRSQLERIHTRLASLEDLDLTQLRDLARELEQRRKQDRGVSALPGLEFESQGFRLLVGRNSRENDQLLRRATRGNDWWLHTRDYPGGYVFIRNRAGKSIPLEVLLDAGNLALFFSKARSAGKANLYYTQVKYLRRAKDGPQGLVLPTQEKNLTVELDKDRLSRLGVGATLEQ
ncbi:MAG: NFACT RNA binding domain-containing protein [Alkalispirochaeta sp.]